MRRSSEASRIHYFGSGEGEAPAARFCLELHISRVVSFLSCISSNSFQLKHLRSLRVRGRCSTERRVTDHTTRSVKPMVVRECARHRPATITESMPQVRSVTIGVWLTRVAARVGGQGGIAHFVEHMLFKGTDSRSHEDIALIDSIGGQLDAFTAKGAWASRCSTSIFRSPSTSSPTSSCIRRLSRKQAASEEGHPRRDQDGRGYA